MNGLLRVLSIFVLLSAANAATVYYAQSSAGGNTGADCADAKALSAVTWTAGNTYHQCGTITSRVSPGVSGSAGNVITIIFETNSKISMTSCGSTGCLDLAGLTYITVDGGSNGIIEATGSGSAFCGGACGDSIGIYGRSGMGHVEIKNLAINNMYVHNSASDNNGNDFYGIWFDGSNNLIHNNVIHDTMGGIKAETPASSNQVYSNTINNINWGIFFSGSGSSANSMTQNLIHDNEIYDFANWDTTADTYHHDGLFLTGGSVNTTTTLNQLYNNYIHGTSSSAVTCAGAGSGSCMTAYIYVNSETTNYIYNNLLVANPGDTGPNNGWILMFSDDSDYLFNNTVIGGSVASSPTAASCIVLNTSTNFTVENNIMSNCNVLMWLSGTVTFTALDYNTYQASSLQWRKASSYYTTLANWRTSSGGDAHGQAQTGSLNLNSSTYVPQAGSAVIGAATNLTSLGIAALDSDKAGVARPGGATAWDAGAYQFTNTVINGVSGATLGRGVSIR